MNQKNQLEEISIVALEQRIEFSCCGGGGDGGGDEIPCRTEIECGEWEEN